MTDMLQNSIYKVIGDLVLILTGLRILTVDTS